MTQKKIRFKIRVIRGFENLMSAEVATIRNTGEPAFRHERNRGLSLSLLTDEHFQFESDS